MSLAISLMVGIAVAAQAVPLEGSYWRLVSLDERMLQMPQGAAAPHIALHRETDRIAGFGGCNRFFAQYVIAADRLSVTIMGGGRAQCPDTSLIEREFLGALAQVKRFELSGNELILSDAQGPRLRFDAVAQ